jgi:uncharacterized membrane protein YhaH (DUF805 family)
MNWFMHSMQNYANFSGRARRREFAWFQVISVAVLAILALASLYNLLQGLGPRGSIVDGGIAKATLYLVLLFVFSLVIAVPSWAVLVRRLHDIGVEGWWSLLVFVPGLGAIFMVALAFINSKPGPNQYGPNPKGE